MIIKALSLWQPWATAMALKLKKNETRHWSTNYRGWLAIHAAKRAMTKGERAMLMEGVSVPMGCVVCVVRLVGIEKTDRLRELVTEHEEWWGDYSDGRYAWCTSPMDMIEIPEPIPCVGHQGLFDWETPEWIAKRIRLSGK